jgi:hypothetical protein
MPTGPLGRDSHSLSLAEASLRWSGPLGDKVPGARQGGVLMVVDLPRVMCMRAAAQLRR